jgi:hypothetical protein
VEPVNRYPDFVKNLIRQLKRLFPTMGYERMAVWSGNSVCPMKANVFSRKVKPAGVEARPP